MFSLGPTMPDLATALQQVLRQVREDTKHDLTCLTRSVYFTLPPNTEPCGLACTCDFAERVEAEQARRWHLSIEATVHEHRGNVPAAEWPGMQASAYRAALEAAGAAQQERGSA